MVPAKRASTEPSTCSRGQSCLLGLLNLVFRCILYFSFFGASAAASLRTRITIRLDCCYEKEARDYRRETTREGALARPYPIGSPPFGSRLLKKTPYPRATTTLFLVPFFLGNLDFSTEVSLCNFRSQHVIQSTYLSNVITFMSSLTTGINQKKFFILQTVSANNRQKKNKKLKNSKLQKNKLFFSSKSNSKIEV